MVPGMDNRGAALAAWLDAFSERDALISGARHHVSMATTARLAGRGRRVWGVHMAQAATYRRMLAV